MHFRYYASTMGRFMKPDNMITNAANPQGWNLYSYVNNSPINFNDPTGHGGNIPGSTKISREAPPGGSVWDMAEAGRMIPIYEYGQTGDNGTGEAVRNNGAGGENGEVPLGYRASSEMTINGYARIVGWEFIPDAGGGNTIIGGIPSTRGDIGNWWSNFRRGVYWGTGYGEKALNYYADIITDPGSSLLDKAGAGLAGGASALWQENTYWMTYGTLMVGAAALASDAATTSPAVKTRFKLSYHGSGPDAYPHLDIIIYLEGVKGSDVHFRVPLPFGSRRWG